MAAQFSSHLQLWGQPNYGPSSCDCTLVLHIACTESEFPKYPPDHTGHTSKPRAPVCPSHHASDPQHALAWAVLSPPATLLQHREFDRRRPRQRGLRNPSRRCCRAGRLGCAGERRSLLHPRPARGWLAQPAAADAGNNDAGNYLAEPSEPAASRHSAARYAGGARTGDER